MPSFLSCIEESFWESFVFTVFLELRVGCPLEMVSGRYSRHRYQQEVLPRRSSLPTALPSFSPFRYKTFPVSKLPVEVYRNNFNIVVVVEVRQDDEHVNGYQGEM